MRKTLITTLAAIMLAASLPATAGRRDAPPAQPVTPSWFFFF